MCISYYGWICPYFNHCFVRPYTCQRQGNCDIQICWKILSGRSGRAGIQQKWHLKVIQLYIFSFYNRSEEHTSELQSRGHLVCRLLLEKKKAQVYASQSRTEQQ